MTSSQKQDIYNLLDITNNWVLGYKDPFFTQNSPLFEDDTEQSPQSEETVITQTDTPEIKTAETGTVSNDVDTKLLNIASKIKNCQNCNLCKTRTNTVPGEGVSKPYVLVIGEGPGEDEDLSGRPFVGKAGQLLDKMLAAISLDRNINCYIANIVKCRPPHNRTPEAHEAQACSGYLQAQIHTLKPKMILAMGRTAVQNLLDTAQGINSLRGQLLDYNGIPLMATYHPSALLRDESLKRPAWNDLKAFREELLKLAPEYAEAFDNNHPKV